MSYEGIARDGFSCSFGRFFAEPGHVERVSGVALRDAFLPKQTPAGNKFIRDGGERFVRGQFKHYDVTFDEREFSGNGTLLLKKILRAGKCDEVPDRITKLRAEMHAEWLTQLSLEQLSGQPEWAMEKYFLTSGKPDRAKTSAVIGIPLDKYSSYRADQMRKAASEITGLHQATGHGPKTQTIFMGWDSAAVGKAAKGHAAKETKAAKAADEEREKERAASHADYLKTLKRRKGSRKFSPVGGYIVDCSEIEAQWPDLAEDSTFDICATAESGVFEASFDFGVLEGIMILSTDKTALNEYCFQQDSDNDDSEDDDDDTGIETGSKRKATVSAPRGRGKRSKQSKALTSKTLKFHCKIRCTETGEGQIFATPEEGTVTFKGENMVEFSAVASLPCVGSAVNFTGRKITDTGDPSGKAWSDYSEGVAESARIGRWH
ncbi:hypothetical protein GGS24DRAFT_477423 [Hypoxylon argillaceum]|nr:hypothetical protein GGS24DRAFT_477423 [Hypoxylon argillaceum]KAI1144788.1 hypothetical protein F4825DRAFT_309296 [Nemania diffusa]